MTVWRVAVLAVVALFFVKDVLGFSTCPIRRSGSRPWNTVLLHSAAKPSSTTRRQQQRPPQRNKHNKKNRPWTYAPLSAARRQKVVSLVNDLEEGTAVDNDDVEAHLDVLAQWARLGEGERAESACNGWMVQSPSSSLDKTIKNKAFRRVLHAWCNQLTRLTSSSSRQQQPRPSSSLSTNNEEFKELANRAEQVMKKMDPLEAGDYQAVIQAHAQCLQVASALYLLHKWKEPTAAAYASVIRCILSPYCHVQYYERNNKRITPVAMAHELIEQQHASRSNNKLSTQVYNRVLNAWSRSLKPFHKKTVGKNRKEESAAIMNKVEWIWENIEKPDAKSFVLMIYNYCKSGRVDDAYKVWEKLMQRLQSRNNKRERVDARSFKMMVNALSTSNELESAQRIDGVLKGMWKLHELGYEDTAPDVFLYTTAMNAWAQHGEVNCVRALLEDLETRYQTLRWDSLEADTAIYNALIHAIGNQENSVNAPEEAGSVVKLMERTQVEPDTITYNTLMDACLASSSEEGIERAEQTLLWMVENFKKGKARVKPTLKSFSSVINAWTAADAPARAEALLDIMEERYRPPASLFESIITSWCKQVQVGSNTDAAKRGMRLLLRMQELFEATGNEAIQPNMSVYNKVIRVLNDSGNTEDAKAVREHRDRTYPPVDSTLEPRRLTSSSEVFGLLQYLENVPPLSPRTSATVQNFNYVLSQLAKSGKIWAGQRAEDVLNYMLENKKKFAPNTVTFNSVMSAYANSSHRNAGEKAAIVLGTLKSLQDLEALKGVKADRISYNTVMNAYAKSSDPMSGSLAEAVFDELEALYEETKDESLRPGIVSYSTLLKALANCGEPYSANRAEEILLRMLKDYEVDSSNVKPNTLCFNEVIYAWARSPDEDASKRAEMVLKLMEDMFSNGNDEVRPDTRTYNVVLYALANGEEDDAPIRAALLLDRMGDEYRDGNDAMKPDAVSYSTVISAWANQGGIGSVNATIMLLEDLYESDIELDSSFFSNLIYSLTRTGTEEAPTAAEIIILDLIKRVESGEVDVQVDTEIYNALINCWGKSGSRGSAARAEEILQEMEDEYAEGNVHVQPNVQTFTSVIDAYAKSRDTDEAKRAESILNRMEDEGVVCPNAHTYTAVIQAYARSDRPSKAKHAQSILYRMKDDFTNGNKDARPSVVTYNAVLNACEFSVGDASEMEEAFRVACDTLDEIRSCDYLFPDQITYGAFLGVIAKLMPKSETTNELIELVFKRCCADGQLGPVALKKLGDAASVSRYRSLLGGVEENVPIEWSRNVAVHR